MIIVTGVPRSGTSLTCFMLAKSGIHFTRDIAESPIEAGIKGNRAYAENMGVSNFMKGLFDRHGICRLGQKNLEFDKRKILTEAIRNRVIEFLFDDGWDGRSPVAVKNCKMVLTPELWFKNFPASKWVIIRRDLDDLAASLERTPFMRNHEPFANWREWAENYQRYFDLIPNDMKVEIWPKKIIDGDTSEIEAACKFLGVEFNKESLGVINNKWYLTAKV